VSFNVDADTSHAEIRSIVEQSIRRSAVYDIVTNQVDVVVDVSS
jgi:hypothetical protein